MSVTQRRTLNSLITGWTDRRTDGRTDGEIKTKLFKGGPNTIAHHGKSVFKRLLASSTGSRLLADIARFCFGTEPHIVHIMLICILNDPVIQRWSYIFVHSPPPPPPLRVSNVVICGVSAKKRFCIYQSTT